MGAGFRNRTIFDWAIFWDSSIHIFSVFSNSPCPSWNFSWMYLPKRLELSFIRVWALPKASNRGFTWNRWWLFYYNIIHESFFRESFFRESFFQESLLPESSVHEQLFSWVNHSWVIHSFWDHSCTSHSVSHPSPTCRICCSSWVLPLHRSISCLMISLVLSVLPAPLSPLKYNNIRIISSSVSQWSTSYANGQFNPTEVHGHKRGSVRDKAVILYLQ